MNEINNEKPSWYPKLATEEYINRLREDYPHIADGCSDEEVIEEFDHGRKYVGLLWDHVGEAYEGYEKLADAFLGQEEEIEKLKRERDKLKGQIDQAIKSHFLWECPKCGFVSHQDEVCNKCLYDPAAEDDSSD